MSVIKITVDDQNLHITDSPKIAAQGVNENYVEFAFSADWDGFGKTAIFYNESDPETIYTSLVDGNSLALIPHEITASEGRISLGLSGVKDNVVKTSEILTYKIVKGLYVAESSDPSPGIYEQMLSMVGAIQSDQAAFKSEIEESIAEFETEAAEDIAEIGARVDNLLDESRPGSVTTLWTGLINKQGESATLSESVLAFDFLDIYLGGVDTKYIRVPASQTSIQIQAQNMSDDGSNPFLYLWESGVTISGTTVSINKCILWSWLNPGTDSPTVTPDAQNGPDITRIDGVKMSDESPAELLDIRVGVDGTTYASAGAAVRTQVSELKNTLIKLANYDVGEISIENLSNGYISTSGVLTDDGICKTTDFFVFTEGMSAISLLHCATTDASWCAISYYDKDKNFLSRTVYAGSATRTGQACILSPITGAKFARVSYRAYAGWTIQLKYLKSPINRLSPKKIDRIEFVQGGLNGIEYNTYQPQRVATLETARYDKDIVVYLPRGHKMAYRSVVNGAQGFDSGWKFGFMYIPARTDFLMLLAKETEDTNVADVAEFTSGMMICDKYSENPTFVHGSLSSGAYVTNNNRIVNVSYFKFDKMCKITPKSGYSVSITEYRNDEFFYDYYWRDIFYIPAGATFRIVVKKNDESMVQLSDDCFDIELVKEESAYSNLKGVNHRGFWTAPENTLEAFALSKENGFHFVETDIAITSDGVPVLLHDETINRTARNLNYSAISSTINIADITYEDALGYTFNSGLGWYRQYIKIPTLEEFLAYCKLNSLCAYLELKTSASYTDAQIQSMVALVKSYAMWESVTWISFNTALLGKVKNIDASARLGYIVTSFGSSDISIVQGLGNNAFLDAQHEYITDELAQSCMEAGVRLEAWSTSDVKLSELNKYVSRFTNNRWHN